MKNKPIYNFTCNHCGKECGTFNKNQIAYCSRECSWASQRTVKGKIELCYICKRPFAIYYSGQECCSLRCSHIKGGETARKAESPLHRRRELERGYRKDPKFRLNTNMRQSIHNSIRRNSKNGRSWKRLVDYSIDDLMKHLERKFDKNMSWDNWGEYWHIDHILPISKFNFEKPEDDDFKRCWALNNLQPLEATKNIRKQNKLKRPMQPRLIFN